MTIYGTLAQADTYHEQRGNTDWAAAATDKRNVALLVGSEFIDTFSRQYSGVKTDGRDQERAWPRTGAVDSGGLAYLPDEIPLEIEKAAYEAALLYVQGIPLVASPTDGTSGSIVREMVKAGPVETETEYVAGSTSSGRPYFQKINDLLDEVFYISPLGGASVPLLRV